MSLTNQQYQNNLYFLKNYICTEHNSLIFLQIYAKKHWPFTVLHHQQSNNYHEFPKITIGRNRYIKRYHIKSIKSVQVFHNNCQKIMSSEPHQ